MCIPLFQLQKLCKQFCMVQIPALVLLAFLLSLPLLKSWPTY
ncbi:unnamed protein product, partial [Vitis vinifera]